MYVWATCTDYARTYVETTWRQCTSVTDSGTLTAGTLTTGTTLFDTANNPTSEMHIGRLYTHNDIYLLDGKKVNYGSSNDLQIYHDVTNSLIRNYTGNLIIQNDKDDGDIIIRSDDGSGGVTPYLTFDGGNVQMVANQKLAFNDSVRATFGASSDLQIYHNGTTSNSNIENYTGGLYITNYADDQDIIFRSDDSSGGVTEYLRLDGGIKKTIFSQDARWIDGKKALFGNSGDLQIYHDGSNSYVQDAGDGELRLNSDNGVRIRKHDNETLALFSVDGSASLWYDNAQKLATTSSGVQITGTLDVDVISNASGVVHLNDTLYFQDNSKAVFGDSSDLEIFHDGSNSYIRDVGTGNLWIGGVNVHLGNPTASEYYIQTISNGAVTLYYDNSAKLATKSDGVDITGELQSDSLDVDGNADISGNLTVGGDLNVGTADLIKEENSQLKIQSGQGVIINIDNNDSGPDVFSVTKGSSGSTILQISTSGNSSTFSGPVQATSFSDGTISGITFIDEDSFSTNSATRVPTQQSIKAYVDAQVAGVVDTAPSALNTLNELAAALGDDASFSTTTSTALGNRLRVDTASQGLTGTQQANAITNLGITATKAELNLLDGVTATTTEFNYLDGVGNNIQTQLNQKANLSGATFTGTITTGGDIDLTGVSDTADEKIILPRGGHIAFYGNGSLDHAISSMGTDDIRINSYGAIILNLDSNSNQTNAANFRIVKHGGGSSAGTAVFSVDGENGNLTVTGTVDGRDVASDGTKLDGISAGADVTPSWVPSSDPGYLTSSSTQSKYLRSDTADTASGTITFSLDTLIAEQKYFGYSSTYNYKPRVTGGIGTRSEMISAANMLIHGDTDGTGTGEFVSIRAGAGTANELKIVSKTSAASQSSSALVFNGGQVFHAGNSAQFTSALNTKLSGIETGADVTPSWVPSSNPNYLTSVPNHSAALITSGTLNSSRLPTDLGSTRTLSGANAILKLQETDVTNSPTWWHVADGGNYSVRLNNSGTYPISINTNGTNNAVSNIVLGYNTDFSAGIDVTGTITSGDITSTGNSQFNGNVQVGDTVNQNAYGLLQVNQTANNDEEGIGILSASHARSMRIWVDETSSYINSGNGGAANLVFNEAITVSSGGNLTGVGVIRTTDGANTSVSYGFTGDINTGMYSPANHELGFTTNGGQRLKLDSTGATVTGNLAVTGTVDGVDIAARNGVLTSTTTTANAALPKAGGTMTGNLAMTNYAITAVANLTFNDPGPNEGIAWSGGNTKIYESPDDLTTNSAGNLQFVYGSTRRFTVNSTGVDVNGALTATTKSFDIEHPSKKGMRLHHGVVEGPEHSVYVRGKSKEKVILLPDYWVDLIHEDTITVQLTAIGSGQDLYVEDIKDNKVYVNGENYFYYIQAERKDVERFEVEYESNL